MTTCNVMNPNRNDFGLPDVAQYGRKAPDWLVFVLMCATALWAIMLAIEIVRAL